MYTVYPIFFSFVKEHIFYMFKQSVYFPIAIAERKFLDEYFSVGKINAKFLLYAFLAIV